MTDDTTAIGADESRTPHGSGCRCDSSFPAGVCRQLSEIRMTGLLRTGQDRAGYSHVQRIIAVLDDWTAGDLTDDDAVAALRHLSHQGEEPQERQA